MNQMIVTRTSCAISEDQYQVLGHQNWVPASGVEVSFDIRHRGTSILLNYFVQEPQVRAVNTEFNSPVWEDSCVEFFIRLEDDPNYYNFEFNAIGTVLGAYGPDRNSRSWLPDEVLQEVQTTPSLGKGIIETLEGDISWTLEIVIPVAVLVQSGITDISGQQAHANFYKCGDKLKQPHFLSWQPVLTDQPNFHLPQHFGELRFE
jgi:hypothetical protein